MTKMAPKMIMFSNLALCLLLFIASSAEAREIVSRESKMPFVNRMLRLDPNPDPRCLRGFRHKRGRRLCCAPGCTKCGGDRCAQGGGRKFCCGGAIRRSNRSCDRVGPPCVSSISFPRSRTPDPSCKTGLLRGGICCPEGCRRCGGSGCLNRTPAGALERSCCRKFWKTGTRTCNRVGAPCRVVTGGRSAPKPVVDKSRWVTITDTLTGRPTPRHEACMAWYEGKGYLIGGRKIDPVEIFDPAAKTWKKGTGPGFLMHHMQCVAWGGKIWVASAWTGGFPKEKQIGDVWVYDIASDSWSTLPGLPESRRRGGAAQILYDDKIWVIGGNQGGHGEHATTLGWMDYFDLKTEKWSDSDLPDLPEGRDHVQGAVVNDEMLCIAGGRDGGVEEFFTATITSTYCYTPSTNRWKRMEDLPGDGRGGSMCVTTCDGHMMIVGGERLKGPASSQVDIFDGAKWRTTTSVNRGRHGGGLVVSDCNTCGKIYAVSGSGGRGGGPELDSTEMYLAGGVDFRCRSF